jgi:hypothetical protein
LPLNPDGDTIRDQKSQEQVRLAISVPFGTQKVNPLMGQLTNALETSIFRHFSATVGSHEFQIFLVPPAGQSSENP